MEGIFGFSHRVLNFPSTVDNQKKYCEVLNLLRGEFGQLRFDGKVYQIRLSKASKTDVDEV